MVHYKKRTRSLPKTVSCLLNAKNQLIIPNRALSNVDLFRYASCLKIPFFRGVFMKDDLPTKMWYNESGIINLDNSDGPGTHWVCYKKLGLTIYYFDSFGNLPPPKEVQIYFRSAKQVFYNYERHQPDNTSICGHLCLEFLAKSVSQL
jgi:hypothetical protein